MRKPLSLGIAGLATISIFSSIGAVPASAASRSSTGAPSCRVAQATSCTVRRGDTLYAIAKKNNTTVARLQQLNQDRYPSLAHNVRLIHAGWVIKTH